MILPLAIVLHTAAQCAPANGPSPETLAAYAKVESGLNPLAIRDDTDRRSYYPQTEAEAIALARRLIDAGHRIGAGIMQVESDNFGWLHLTPETAFGACASIRAGAEYLVAASVYNTGSPTRGFRDGYVARIVANERRLADIATAAAPPDETAIDPFVTPSESPRDMSFAGR
jgi:type IV secretion system protein VirB1